MIAAAVLAPAVLAPIFYSAVLGVHLESAVDLELAEAAKITETVAARLAHRTGRKFALDDLLWSSACSADDRCIGETRARLDAEEVVLVQVYGGPIKVRVVLELIGPRSAHAEARLSRDPAAWTEPLDRAAETLFPMERSLAPRSTSTSTSTSSSSSSSDAALARAPDAPVAERSYAPWIMLGASAVVAGVGLAFGTASAAAKDDLIGGGPRAGSAFRSDESPMQDRALAANLCFGAAIVGAAGGLVWLALE